jgi:hypothetical protein
MFSREKKLQEAAIRAKMLVEKLHEKYPQSKQWDYELMGQQLKETYKSLKEVWQDGRDLEKVKHYLSDNGYKFLLGNSEWVDVKWFDLLECFDFELEDVAIISVENLPGQSSDRFIAWLDHEVSANKSNDLHKDRIDFVDEFPQLSGFTPHAFNVPLFKVVGLNDCWTFIWNTESERWVLDFVIFDRLTDTYLSTLGKSLDIEDGLNYSHLKN